MEENKEVTRKDLKIQALLQKISILTTQYESQDADRRVSITELSQENESLRKRIAELEAANVVEEKTSPENPSD